VLLLWSILPFIPEERRLNFLVLDEPETNVDQSGLQIFREVLIPKLSQMIPSLVVISTNESLMRPGARVMTVVKKGNQSTLVKGRVKDSDLRSKSSSK
jgi:ABC-type protease/lipase transport system fused ATPase/permease subunit